MTRSLQPLEPEGSAREHRERMVREMETLIAARRAHADQQRANDFRPDTSSLAAYHGSVARYRSDLCGMLGWPLSPAAEGPADSAVETIPVGEDDLGTITRLWIPTLPGVSTYGILFLPRGPSPFPLILCQHGGLGTPELCSGLWGSTGNYNNMVDRVRRRGLAAFVPQLQLWDKRFEPDNRRDWHHRSLVQLGGSIAALEIFRLSRCLDYLAALPQIDASRIGMVGLSYGGFYTQFATAIDTRIKAALSSCFFNDRHLYNLHDWLWHGSGHRFHDAEVAQLICPRPLWIEVGRNDELFTPAGAIAEAAKVAETYTRLGIADRFHFRVFEGTHEFAASDDGMDFLCAATGSAVSCPQQPEPCAA